MCVCAMMLEHLGSVITNGTHTSYVTACVVLRDAMHRFAVDLRFCKPTDVTENLGVVMFIRPEFSFGVFGITNVATG